MAVELTAAFVDTYSVNFHARISINSLIMQMRSYMLPRGSHKCVLLFLILRKRVGINYGSNLLASIVSLLLYALIPFHYSESCVINISTIAKTSSRTKFHPLKRRLNSDRGSEAFFSVWRRTKKISV